MLRTHQDTSTHPGPVRRSPASSLLDSNQRLEERVGELLAIQDAGRALAGQLECDRLLETCVETVSEVAGARTVSVLLLDPSGESLVVRARRSVDRRRVRGMRRALGDGIAGWVAERRVPLLVADAQRHPVSRGVPRGEGYASDSFAAVPLLVGARLVGVVCATDKADGRPFDERDLRLLLGVGAQAAIALENALSVSALRDRAFAALCSAAEAAEARSPLRHAHGRRVAECAANLGYEIGLSDREMDVLRRAARVHDIGWVAVCDSVLTNHGSLTERERTSVRQHPVTGERIARELGFLDEELSLILHHHERWDGLGYPAGLKEHEIDPLARVLAAADAFVALVSERPHRTERTRRAAVDELAAAAGTQLDPGLIEPLAKTVDGHLGGA